MHERGVEISHEAVQPWGLKLGAEFPGRLRRPGRPGDTLHLDKCSPRSTASWSICRAPSIRAERYSMSWRRGAEIRRPRCGSFESSSRVCGLLHAQSLPLSWQATAPLRGTSFQTWLLIGYVSLEQQRGNLAQPSRERERAVRRFKSIRHAQRFVAVHARIASHFRPGRPLMRAFNYRTMMIERFASRSEIAGTRNSAANST